MKAGWQQIQEPLVDPIERAPLRLSASEPRGATEGGHLTEDLIRELPARADSRA